MKAVLILLIRAYQYLISPLMHTIAGPGSGCRYEEPCSQYGIRVIREEGAFKGAVLSARRIFSCQPWAKPFGGPLKSGHSSYPGSRFSGK